MWIPEWPETSQVASHDTSLCKFCGEKYSSERYLRHHIDEKHIFDIETNLKREISANSKLEHPAKHKKPSSDSQETVIKSSDQERVKILIKECWFSIVRSIEETARTKDATIAEYKTLITHTQQKRNIQTILKATQLMVIGIMRNVTFSQTTSSSNQASTIQAYMYSKTKWKKIP